MAEHYVVNKHGPTVLYWTDAFWARRKWPL